MLTLVFQKTDVIEKHREISTSIFPKINVELLLTPILFKNRCCEIFYNDCLGLKTLELPHFETFLTPTLTQTLSHSHLQPLAMLKLPHH